ncbi:hypothetical protein INT43_007505 [Umbelopsis isabellina]|uniref:Uncharacterized protein n=1 Tax=Mortierella isabellina TaxID=91625 RepID=A0A8H7UKV2_MORIS|nr:hypothetical protein INT43_007505 [Umbelopsis isabellina]
MSNPTPSQPWRGRGRGGHRGRSRGRSGFRGNNMHSRGFNRGHGPPAYHTSVDEPDDGSVEYLYRRYGSLYSPNFTLDPWKALNDSK